MSYHGCFWGLTKRYRHKLNQRVLYVCEFRCSGQYGNGVGEFYFDVAAKNVTLFGSDSLSMSSMTPACIIPSSVSFFKIVMAVELSIALGSSVRLEDVNIEVG